MGSRCRLLEDNHGTLRRPQRVLSCSCWLKNLHNRRRRDDVWLLAHLWRNEAERARFGFVSWLWYLLVFTSWRSSLEIYRRRLDHDALRRAHDASRNDSLRRSSCTAITIDSSLVACPPFQQQLRNAFNDPKKIKQASSTSFCESIFFLLFFFFFSRFQTHWHMKQRYI